MGPPERRAQVYLRRALPLGNSVSGVFEVYIEAISFEPGRTWLGSFGLADHAIEMAKRTSASDRDIVIVVEEMTPRGRGIIARALNGLVTGAPLKPAARFFWHIFSTALTGAW